MGKKVERQSLISITSGKMQIHGEGLAFLRDKSVKEIGRKD